MSTSDIMAFKPPWWSSMIHEIGSFTIHPTHVEKTLPLQADYWQRKIKWKPRCAVQQGLIYLVNAFGATQLTCTASTAGNSCFQITSTMIEVKFDMESPTSVLKKPLRLQHCHSKIFLGVCEISWIRRSLAHVHCGLCPSSKLKYYSDGLCIILSGWQRCDKEISSKQNCLITLDCFHRYCKSRSITEHGPKLDPKLPNVGPS